MHAGIYGQQVGGTHPTGMHTCIYHPFALSSPFTVKKLIWIYKGGSTIRTLTLLCVFTQGVLDYLDNLTVPQIRKLYSMLSILAFRNRRSETLIQDEMHIIIRKQLTNSNTKYELFVCSNFFESITALLLFNFLAGSST